MTVELLNQITRQTMETIFFVVGPVLIVSLVIGLLISFFQTITSIQEITLTFIPKIAGVLLCIFLTMPWMAKILVRFTESLFQHIPLYIK